jgi:hypothetical protein
MGRNHLYSYTDVPEHAVHTCRRRFSRKLEVFAACSSHCL